MRIVQVSAHYPPDFVSGGTLIPQRLARSVSRAGHTSAVFAGDVNSLEPLDRQVTHDGNIEISWIGISSFLAWDNRANFDNKDVARAFDDYLADIAPDIVHLHSLQTFGSELVTIAARHGAKVVVSMHDFWWVCARQFLVDRDMHPCSPVVSCGRCQCAVSHEWLMERNQTLARDLAAAHAIIVPSHTMKTALEANGIDPATMTVIPNGITGKDGVELTRTGPVRFMYAGGTDALKGWDVLREALDLLPRDLDIEFDIYGRASGVPDWVTIRDAYHPDEAGKVFASHDVLVVPSLARESHSMITREALAAGMTVICSDSFGPEEAIANGVNGRVVQAGDARELAAAIGDLADRETAHKLQNKGSSSEIIDPDEQMRRHLELYETLVTKESGGMRLRDVARAAITEVLYVIGIQGAPARYRAHLPAEALATRNIRTTIVNYRDPSLPDRALAADAVVFYRVPATNDILDLIDEIRSNPRIIPILGDVDDLIFDPEIESSLDNLSSLTTEERDLWREGIYRYRTTLEHCDFFLGSTPTISAEAQRLMGMPTRTYPNGVSALLARISEEETRAPREEGPRRIGFFSGTKTHDADWASIEPAIATILTNYPDVELWLGGLVEPTTTLAEFSSRIVRLPLVPWHELPHYLRQVDVCLAPLTAESIFNEAKSAIKWVEAALVRTPVVASPTQPFREVIVDGETGFLASSEQEWVDRVGLLLNDSQLRDAVGRRAHRTALMTLSPERQGRLLENTIVDAWFTVARDGHRKVSAIEPVVRDEPYTALATEVEPYDVTLPAPARTGLIRRVFHSVREVGVGQTLVRARRKLFG